MFELSNMWKVEQSVNKTFGRRLKTDDDYFHTLWIQKYCTRLRKKKSDLFSKLANFFRFLI